MNVLLTTLTTSVVPESRLPKGSNDGPVRKLRACAAIDRIGEHTLVDDPEEADLILFAVTETMVGDMALPLRRHAYTRRYRDKVFVYNLTPAPIPFLPGVYPSIERRDDHPARTRSGHYLHIDEPPEILRPHHERDLLYSFVGSVRTAPIRAAVMKLTGPSAWLEDVSAISGPVRMQGEAEKRAFVTHYADVLSRSRFSLCPRGFGAGTYRLFESLRAGCVPVIISDQWVPPTGPDWSSFTVRVPEASVEQIPTLLRALDDRSAEMSARARRAWEEWFSDEVSFHRVVEWCREIARARQLPELVHPGRIRAHASAYRWEHVRRRARRLHYRLRDALFGPARARPPATPLAPARTSTEAEANEITRVS